MGTQTGNATWIDYPSSATPITAETLNNIEDAIDSIAEATGASGRTTATVTTVSLAVAEVLKSSIVLNKAYRVYSIETDGPARVRLYASVAQQTADELRGITDPLVGDHGVFLDFVTTDTVLASVLSPFVDGATFDGSKTVPMTVTNLGVAPTTITVDLVYLETEF